MMRKNLFDPAVKDELANRIERIEMNSQPEWGEMNSAEMFYHCSKSLQLIMGAKPNSYSSTFKQKIFRQIFLYLVQKLPKDAPTKKDLNVKKSGIQVGTFDEEKSKLLQELDAFSSAKALHAMHPYFGKLSLKQWGIFTWMHFDHHLRQFSV